MRLYGQGSIESLFDLSLVARRWQAFNFDAETKVKFEPKSYQAMAGLTNYYNDKHYSWIFITWNEINGAVIEVAQNNRGTYTSFLKDNAIKIPEGTEYVWFRTKVRKRTYTYEYSFDGQTYLEVPVTLDAAILSDDYVNQTMGGFFTGAFAGGQAVCDTRVNVTVEDTTVQLHLRDTDFQPLVAHNEDWQALLCTELQQAFSALTADDAADFFHLQFWHVNLYGPGSALPAPRLEILLE